MNKLMNEICKYLGVGVISIIAILIIIRTLSWQQSIIKRVMVTREGFGHDDSDSDSDDDSDDDDSGDEDAMEKIQKNKRKIKEYERLMDKSKKMKDYKKYEKKVNKLKIKNEKLLSGGGSMF